MKDEKKKEGEWEEKFKRNGKNRVRKENVKMKERKEGEYEEERENRR